MCWKLEGWAGDPWSPRFSSNDRLESLRASGSDAHSVLFSFLFCTRPGQLPEHSPSFRPARGHPSASGAGTCGAPAGHTLPAAKSAAHSQGCRSLFQCGCSQGRSLTTAATRSLSVLSSSSFPFVLPRYPKRMPAPREQGLRLSTAVSPVLGAALACPRTAMQPYRRNEGMAPRW